MGIVVQKFGGTSVANKERIENIANIIKETYKKGNDIIVVVSAQGDTTDELIDKALEINPKPSKRELDQLLNVGEQISISLVAMALEKMGLPVISLLGWQSGIITNSVYNSARIKKIDITRIENEISKHNIVIIAGFQGINKYDDLTTLGRGGSDTTAVAVAAAINADKCQIFTDVEGVYTADPRKVKNAIKLKEITYDEMLELAILGAQVLNNRSVELAKKFGVKLEVLSSLNPVPGTIVKEDAKMEKMIIRGITKDTNISLISIIGVNNKPGEAFKVFSKLANNNIDVNVIIQSIGRDENKDIVFSVAKDKCEEALKILEETISDAKIVTNDNLAKVSIVGAGMISHPGTASKMFEALYDSNINIQMISTSEINISVLIDLKDADKAVSAIHDSFFGK